MSKSASTWRCNVCSVTLTFLHRSFGFKYAHLLQATAWQAMVKSLLATFVQAFLLLVVG